MPLAMMWPQGVNSPGRREAVYVSFVDIAPTILEIAGTDPSAAGMAPLPGGSLVPLLRNEPDPCAALLANIIDSTCVFKNCRNIRCHKAVAICHTKNHRAVFSCHINLARIILKHHSKCI